MKLVIFIYTLMEVEMRGAVRDETVTQKAGTQKALVQLRWA
ncbi:MAG TPA: hypothetical protein VK120_06235 [Sporosarcina sp.]|nr:hypothetical protein [Sporosarcina sp.]